MIEISPNVKINENKIQFNFIRGSGPGGQNINKVASSVQLRFDVRNSTSLDPEIKQRLIKIAGNRINDQGVLIIDAKRFRTQEQNRFDATLRLIDLIRKASITPKKRKATHPSVTAKAARRGEKKKHSETKRLRRYIPEDWE